MSEQVHIQNPIECAETAAQVREALSRIVQQDERYQRFMSIIIRTAPVMIVALPSREIVFATEALEALFGYIKGSLLGKDMHTIVPERFREKHLGHIAEFAKHPRHRPMGTIGMDLIGLKNDGSEFRIEVGLEPFIWANTLYVSATVTPGRVTP